ncbi:MAG: Flp pilus assembly protein CpaB [Streptosporangiales bacterium]|nr:Flp pilus assembly protein CpaB [Streptosporangiales bacterium]
MNPRQRRGVLLMILAAIGAVVVFLGLMSYVQSVRSEVGAMTYIYALKQDVPANSQIDETVLTQVEVPARWSTDTTKTFITDVEQLRGKVTVTNLAKGAWLQQGMVIDAPSLRGGQREIAIMIDAETGVAGKVQPGSVVDIYATFQPQGRTVTKPCVIRVLARQTVLEVGTPAAQREAGEAGGFTGASVPITFALTAKDSLRLAYVESFADKLRLALVGSGQDDGSAPAGEQVCSPTGS